MTFERERLAMFRGLHSAIERRHELVDVLAISETSDEAILGIQRLLNVSSEVAEAVVDMQFRRLTVQGRSRILDEIDELSSIADGDKRPGQ